MIPSSDDSNEQFEESDATGCLGNESAAIRFNRLERRRWLISPDLPHMADHTISILLSHELFKKHMPLHLQITNKLETQNPFDINVSRHSVLFSHSDTFLSLRVGGKFPIQAVQLAHRHGSTCQSRLPSQSFRATQ